MGSASRLAIKPTAMTEGAMQLLASVAGKTKSLPVLFRFSLILFVAAIFGALVLVLLEIL